MNDTVGKKELLQSLKIDKQDRYQDSRSVKPRWLLWLVALLLLAVAALAAWWFAVKNAPITVETATVYTPSTRANRTASVLDASGYVVARRMATVSSKVTGKLLEVFIEEGQKVNAGDVMAKLDPVDALAQQSLASSQVSAARSQTASIQAQLVEARNQAKRMDELVRKGLVPRAQYDQAVAQRDALSAQLNSARKQIKVAQDQRHMADLGVDNTIVRAPFAGVVIAKAAQVGEIVSPLSAGGGFTRTGIGTIVDMDSLEVEVDVNESYIGRVQPNMPITATLNAYADWPIPGHVIAIIPTADRSKATVRVRVGLDIKDPRIVPDMGVRVSFLEEPAQANSNEPTAPAKPRMPSSAVTQRNGEDVVFVIRDDNTAHQQVVTLGQNMPNDEIAVLSGAQSGDSVVLNPPDTLQDGARIQLSPDQD